MSEINNIEQLNHIKNKTMKKYNIDWSQESISLMYNNNIYMIDNHNKKQLKKIKNLYT